MTAASAFSSRLLEKLRSVRESGIHQFALWVVPLAIVLFSAVAFFGFPSLYPATSGTALQFRSLPLEAGHSTPELALAALQTVPQQHRSNVSNGTWFSIELPERARVQPTAIDFPARGIQAITCWRRDTMQTLGSAQGRSSTGSMRANRQGYALTLGQNESGAGASFPGILCQARYGAATLFTANLWSIPSLHAASDRFHRSVALLEAGAITLAIFLSIVALRSRAWAFLLLAVWLVGNLRLGAYALGWDSQWLGYVLPPDWLSLLRKLTLAAYFLVTYTLFTQLFRHRGTRQQRWHTLLQWLGILQLAAVFILPWERFHLLSWMVWGFAIATGLYLLSQSTAHHRKRLLSARSLALAAALAVILASLVFTLLGQETLQDSFGSVIALLLANILAAVAVSGIIRDHHTTSQPRYFALGGAALADEHVEGSLQDSTPHTQAMDALQAMVDNDPLTQALNRRGIEKKLNDVIAGLEDSRQPCSLAYMDLDHFKRINGLFGHTSGDEILQQVTARLRGILTDQQSLGRIGSDEFIILFPNMHAAQARLTAQRIIEGLNDTAYQVGQRYFNIRSAIGVVEINPGMDAPSAISAATRACRDARKQHQDVVVYEHDSSELQAHTEELRLFDQLEGGASPRGLYLEMQPIMALAKPNETLNFEILLRVRDSQGQLIPTGKIVGGAEESGTVTIIDKWVFSATLEWLSKHDERLRKTLFVNVNLSGVSLNNDKFIDNLFQVLGRYPQLTHRLCVEITEGVALQNLDRTRKLIKRLQRMGVRIALDDFGAGYTSFSYLRQLGADALKIDGTLVRDMMASETNIAIVRTIVDLAQNMGMISIAEWVEDVQALDILRDMGVDYVQGFAISPALTPMEILDAESLSDLVGNADTLAYIRRQSPGPNPRS